jgi:uncharacterized protein involved in exopolysaccharide biosynthesis
VADLEKQLAAMPETGPATASVGVTPEELVRRDRISSMRAEIESLGRQIRFKEAEERRLGGVIADYQSRIEAVPGVESEYLALTRDYDTMQASFRDLLTKSEAARVAEDLENRQIGEQFRVLDVPRVPLRPISPQRALISAGGLGAGLFLGVLIVCLLEVKDGSLKSDIDVAQVLNLPVVAVIPAMLSTDDKQKMHRRRIVGAIAALALTVVAGYTVWTLRLWQFVV